MTATDKDHRFEDYARAAKVTVLVGTLTQCAALVAPSVKAADLVVRVSEWGDAEWHTLEQLAQAHKASPVTRAAVIVALGERALDEQGRDLSARRGWELADDEEHT
jgi:hypothetical protein